jgi:hypothetical protein
MAISLFSCAILLVLLVIGLGSRTHAYRHSYGHRVEIHTTLYLPLMVANVKRLLGHWAVRRG